MPKIQAGFGNLMVTFTHKEFENFRRYLLQVTEDKQAAANRKIKSVVIRTPADGICFLLNEEELLGLHQMIDYADTEMKSANLIKLFSE